MVPHVSGLYVVHMHVCAVYIRLLHVKTVLLLLCYGLTRNSGSVQICLACCGRKIDFLRYTKMLAVQQRLLNNLSANNLLYGQFLWKDVFKECVY